MAADGVAKLEVLIEEVENGFILTNVHTQEKYVARNLEAAIVVMEKLRHGK